MPITAKQAEKRSRRIGSSDVPALLGVSPWSSAYDCWLVKTGRVSEIGPTDAMLVGTYMEDGILRWAEDEKLGPLRRNQYRSRPDLHLGANIDAITVLAGNPVEAKVSGAFAKSDYGSPGTDEVPAYVAVQATVHMMCLAKDGQTNGADVCHVPVLKGGKLAMYHVPKNIDLAELIAESCIAFWENHVLADVPPEGQGSLEMLKRVIRVEDRVEPVDPALVGAWLAASSASKAAIKAEREAKAALVQALGDAVGGDAGDEGTISYRRQRGAPRVDVAKLREDGLYEKYCTQGSHPVLRHKPRKEQQ